MSRLTSSDEHRTSSRSDCDAARQPSDSEPAEKGPKQKLTDQQVEPFGCYALEPDDPKCLVRGPYRG